MKKYECLKRKSEIFGEVRRPLITVRFFSETRNIWIPSYDTLVDSGADVSIIPRYLGNLLVKDVTDGKKIGIKGIAPDSKLVCYLHTLKVIVAGKELNIPVAIADSNKVLAILGRLKGLDIFNVEFQKGEAVVFG